MSANIRDVSGGCRSFVTSPTHSYTRFVSPNADVCVSSSLSVVRCKQFVVSSLSSALRCSHSSLFVLFPLASSLRMFRQLVRGRTRLFPLIRCSLQQRSDADLSLLTPHLSFLRSLCTPAPWLARIALVRSSVIGVWRNEHHVQYARHRSLHRRSSKAFEPFILLSVSW